MNHRRVVSFLFFKRFHEHFQTGVTFIISGFTIFDFDLILESFRALKMQCWKKIGDLKPYVDFHFCP